MIGKLIKIFSKPAPVEEKEVEEADTTLDNPNFVTDSDKILKLLFEIETHSPLCSIRVPTADNLFSSSILGIKPEEQLILLDELIPREGNRLLQRSKVLKLQTTHKGISLSFNLTDVDTGFSENICFYSAPLPGRIYYPQRRNAPRIEISETSIPFYGVAQKNGAAISGTLFDLSRGGACIDIPMNRSRIMRGDLLRSCQINLGDYVMNFDFSVRFVKPTVGMSRIQIGGLFENLSAKSQSKLSYFITSLERIEIRKRKS